MTELCDEKCVVYGVDAKALAHEEAVTLRRQLRPEWIFDGDAKTLKRTFKFKDFYRTMGFVNAIAYIANVEDHHPDLQVGYDYCGVTFATHSIGGLSRNDFICAAKCDRL